MATHRVGRRAFLGSAAALAAGARLSAQTGSGGAPQTGIAKRDALRFGLASYSLRHFKLDQALAMARTANVRFMTFKDVHLPRTDPAETIRANRAKIEAAGITVMGGGTINMPNDQAQIRRDFEYAKLAGFPLIYASPDPAALDFIEQMAKEHDIRLAIHNHGPEDKWYPAPQDAYRAIKGRHTHLGLCVDVGHTIRAGVDPIEAIVELRERVYDLHVKDLADPKDKDSQVEVGRGILDVPRLLKALLQIGYSGQVGLEYEINEQDPLPGIIESLSYMRGVLAVIAS